VCAYVCVCVCLRKLILSCFVHVCVNVCVCVRECEKESASLPGEIGRNLDHLEQFLRSSGKESIRGCVGVWVSG